MKEQGELTADEVAPLLGVRNPESVMQYYRRGWLEGRWEWAGMKKRYYFTQDAVNQCLRILNDRRQGEG